MKETHLLPPVTQVVTQEFQLSITPLGPDTYLLRTEAVAAGVPLAEAQVTWPLETWLAQAEALFQDPLQALLAAPAPLALGPDSPWIQLGQTLYQGLFQGRIRDSWVAAQGVAQNRRQPLRLRLGFKDSQVQRLPWELVYDGDRPLATGLDVTLCRYYQAQTVIDLAAMAPRSPAGDPIRLLIVISAPNDQERLALRQEVQSLIDNLQGIPGPLALDLTILEQPGRPELAQALEQGKFQILHYAGHSDAGDTGGDLFLVNRQTGLTERLSGEDLAGLLVNNGVRLAVFNSCRGAYTPHDDAQAGWRDQNLVQALVNRGVPGVIAMADRIPDDAALTFTQLLYRNLHQGHSIDLCLSRVRQGLMSAYGSDQPFWMLPLLYLRPDFDGYLYAADSTTASGNAGDDGLAEAALLLPDYSTDPDISSLAAEVFNQQDRDTASSGTAPPLYDWLQDLEQSEPADTAVTNLVERLSQPQPSSNGSGSGSDRPLVADPTESLLPQTSHRPAAPYPQPPPSPAPSTAAEPPLTWPRPRRWSLPPNLLVWGSLGLAGLGAVLGLATITLSTVNRSPGDDPVAPLATNDAGGPANTSPALLSGALNAIALGRNDTARALIEQMLDRNDLTTAASAMAAVAAPQLVDPDLAYVRGRLAWQQMVAGSTAETSPSDALRAWSQATEARPDFLEAWVALGFAHMAMNDYDQAITAWQRAIDIDQRQRRDINPDGSPQVAVPITVNAYAGLALAYHKNSEQAISAPEQAQLQQQAQAYFAQTLALDSTMVNPNTLAINWLWSPSLIGDWQTAVNQLALDREAS